MTRGRGWHGESERHRLARMGVKSVGPSSKSRALSRLKKLSPGMDKFSACQVFVFPLPKPGKMWYDIGGKDHLKDPDLRAALRTWQYLPREHHRINLNTLRSNQPVFTDYIVGFIRSEEAYLDYRSEDPGDEIVVVKWRGENIIADGHHRLSAMELLGKRKADVEFLDLDKFVKEYK